MFFITAESESRVEGAVDEYGDSFARDITVDELKDVRLFSAPFEIEIIGNSPSTRSSVPCLPGSSKFSVIRVSKPS